MHSIIDVRALADNAVPYPPNSGPNEATVEILRSTRTCYQLQQQLCWKRIFGYGCVRGTQVKRTQVQEPLEAIINAVHLGLAVLCLLNHGACTPPSTSNT